MNTNTSRQSFLGDKLDYILKSCIIGIVGLGGGGSQIVQQLAHIGFKNYILYDYDNIEDTNLNRLVGATMLDVELQMPKLSIATRLIRQLNSDAEIIGIAKKWQNESEPLKTCDIIFGCLDGYQSRSELESFARRALISYIDIGMDVICLENAPPRMFGQVIASIPDHPCMRCIGFIDETKLAEEAKKYGDAGVRPQVIWPNSILSSTAVGILMNLLTNWSAQCENQIIYYEYDGNLGVIKPHFKTELIPNTCSHYKTENAGDIIF
jgi:molybdopterin/thiamine biosynthesis adenylyltransferase